MKDFTFPTLPYERVDLEALKKSLKGFIEALKNAKSYEEAKKAYLESEKCSKDFETTISIAYIRHTLDTKDEFYAKEQEYYDENLPLLSPLSIEFNDAVNDSPFKADFEKEYGHQMFVGMELEKKKFCEANIPLRQKEAKLCSEFENLIASCEVEFDGKKLNLYGIQKYFEHEDREVRKQAVRAYRSFYESNEKRLEEIWDELIKLRNEMGRNLGFDNYIPLGYLEQGRTDYGQEEVASFREQVKKSLVPLCEKLYEAQAKRLNVDTIMFYDESKMFADGNAVPAGDDDFMIEQARKMYHDISPETAEFIDFMIDHQLMDLKNKPGKASTGYQTSLPKYDAPFVFSCFNQTIFDMQVLSHELGHAFAAYEAMRTQAIEANCSITTDIAEIHSMSMEQFAYPYAENFFGKDADKFRFAHLQESITFVPFGVAVDEFQHICYSKPELTPKERDLEWKKLEEKYMPWRKYEPDNFFDRGAWWYHKIHIYLYPFYYINYTLTTMGAMEFKTKNHENHEAAWKDYLNLCKCGSSMSYLETLKYANLSNPFNEGSVEKACAYAKSILLDEIKKFN